MAQSRREEERRTRRAGRSHILHFELTEQYVRTYDLLRPILPLPARPHNDQTTFYLPVHDEPPFSICPTTHIDSDDERLGTGELGPADEKVFEASTNLKSRKF